MAPSGTENIWNGDVFARKYVKETSDWGGQSGGGSSTYYTIPYKAFLESFIAANSIRSVLDIGCGDWQFSRFVNFGPGIYHGYDVVEDIVEQNAAAYGSPKHIFRVMPDCLTDLPTCDLLIMKDVLQHFSNERISEFVRVLFPRYSFCLISNSYEKADTPRNIDIANGEFRCLDLTAPPFQLRGAYVCDFGSALWERIRTLLICNGTVGQSGE